MCGYRKLYIVGCRLLGEWNQIAMEFWNSEFSLFLFLCSLVYTYVQSSISNVDMDSGSLFLFLCSYRFQDLFPDADVLRGIQKELDKIIQKGVFNITRLLKNSEIDAGKTQLGELGDGVISSVTASTLGLPNLSRRKRHHHLLRGEKK